MYNSMSLFGILYRQIEMENVLFLIVGFAIVHTVSWQYNIGSRILGAANMRSGGIYKSQVNN